MTGQYCDHGRLVGACEECAFERGKADGRLHPDAVLYPPDAPQRRLAEADLDVEVGDGVTVHVRAADPIPLDLLPFLDAPARRKGKPNPVPTVA